METFLGDFSFDVFCRNLMVKFVVICLLNGDIIETSMGGEEASGIFGRKT
jgi:hypothetical protein